MFLGWPDCEDADPRSQTRQKFKEAYDLHFAAHIERAEKQILLAKHARLLLHLLDDTPVVPGDRPVAYAGEEHAKQILGEAEAELRQWEPSVQSVPSNAGNLHETQAVPASVAGTATSMTTNAPASTVEEGEREKIVA